MGPLILRDLRLAWRNKTAMILGPAFFAIFITLCVIALGADPQQMTTLSGSLIWLAVILSLFLNFPQIFADDYQDGTMEALILSGQGTFSLILSKAISFFIVTFVPFLVVVPLAGITLGLTFEHIAAIALSVLAAAPAFIVYGLLTGALLGRQRSAGLFAVLLSAPFIVPVLIFGLSAIDAYMSAGLKAVEFRALAGINLIALAIGLPAAAAALSANLE